MIRYIIIALALAVLFAVIWTINEERLNRKFKSILSIALVALIVFALFYELMIAQKSDKNLELLKAYNQGKVLVCADANVTRDRFNYEFGTACFMPKREFAELNGLIIPAKSCQIKP